MDARHALNNRDLRIDFLRGFFILNLCAAHFTWLASVAGYQSMVRIYGTQPFGFSSPAEFFVFFSGYVMALVLGRNYGQTGFWLTQARALDRAWSLYVLNAFTLLIIAACAGFLFASAPALQGASGIDRFLADPAGFLFRFLVFRTNFAFFEILRNYIFFIPLIAIFLKMARWHVALPLAISVGIWAAHQFGLTPNYDYATFNPFAWQLLFFAGATIAVVRPMTEWTFPRRALQIAICLALLAACFVAKVTLFGDISGEDIPLAGKTDVGPVRLLHFGLVLWAVLLLTPASERLRRSRLVMTVVAVGQNSLECFCLTNVLVYLGAQLLIQDVESAALYLVILSAILVLVLMSARVFAWFKHEPWRQANRVLVAR